MFNVDKPCRLMGTRECIENGVDRCPMNECSRFEVGETVENISKIETFWKRYDADLA